MVSLCGVSSALPTVVPVVESLLLAVPLAMEYWLVKRCVTAFDDNNIGQVHVELCRALAGFACYH